MTGHVDEKLEDLYELVFQNCNLGPVQDLLRRYKNDQSTPQELRDEIRITGDKAHGIITENLRTAVSRGAIPESEVFALLQESEENGRQHIFFFRPRNPEAIAILSEQERISQSLLGNNWKKSGRLPRLQLQPDGYCWSDFRYIGEGGWVAKLYGHSFTEENTDRREDGPRAWWIKVEMKDSRLVCLARWRPNENLLELRVADSGAQMLLLVLKTHIHPAFDVDRWCIPWEMGRIRHRLLNPEEADLEIYEYGGWSAEDSEKYVLQGGPHIQDAESPAFASDLTKSLISSIAASEEHQKRKLVVHWKPTDQNGNKKNLRTVLGTIANTHEMIVSAQASSQGIDDVIHRLLQFEAGIA